MDSIFLKLVDGARVKNHLGLRMTEGYEYKHGKNYMYLDIPAVTLNEEIKRNQHVFLEAAGTIEVKGRSIAEIEPNPALAEFGQVQSAYKVHPDSGIIKLGVWFTAHKALDLGSVDYLVRLYLHP